MPSSVWCGCVGHTAARGADLPNDALLRYRDGRPLTSRRYDHLWRRHGQQLPWVAAQGVSTHWLRHTTLTWVERHFGYGIARAYAGRTNSTGPATTYIKATLHETATALAAMTGQSHPRPHMNAPPRAPRRRRPAHLRVNDPPGPSNNATECRTADVWALFAWTVASRNCIYIWP
jgi:hypothetical protein